MKKLMALLVIVMLFLGFSISAQEINEFPESLWIDNLTQLKAYDYSQAMAINDAAQWDTLRASCLQFENFTFMEGWFQIGSWGPMDAKLRFRNKFMVKLTNHGWNSHIGYLNVEFYERAQFRPELTFAKLYTLKLPI